MQPEFDPEYIEILIRQTECKHLHLVLEAMGSRWFDGEVMDDLHSVLICTDCGFIFEEEQDGTGL